MTAADIVWNAYAEANRRIHVADSVEVVKTEDGFMIECTRCHEKMDYAEQAEGCEDFMCPLQRSET